VVRCLEAADLPLGPRVHAFGNVQNTLAVLECLCDQLRFPITRAREYILVYREGQILGPLGSEDLQELLPSGDGETKTSDQMTRPPTR
jgi:hypothetical protein